MAKHKKHHPTVLVDALEHVVYEIWKHRQSIVYYPQILRAGGDAALEFRVLHHRVLLEFFYGPAKHADNIVAWEYIDDWKQTHDPNALPWLDEYMTRCHTLLAHISTTRSELAKRGLRDWTNDWQVADSHLNQTIRDFLGGLSQDHKTICHQWIRKWLKNNHRGNDVLAGLETIISHP
jgi:hypothetical protein